MKIAVAHRAPWDPAVREEDFTEDCKSISGLASWFGFYGQAAAVGMKAIDCDFLFAKEQNHRVTLARPIYERRVYRAIVLFNTRRANPAATATKNKSHSSVIEAVRTRITPPAGSIRVSGPEVSDQIDIGGAGRTLFQVRFEIEPLRVQQPVA